MHDDTTKTDSTGTSGPTQGDETFGWTDDASDGSTGSASGESVAAGAREWLNQLQAMIENIATQAAPVMREVGAKAAELAATAGEKAGPVAARAAELTAEAGHRLAERSRDFAADLRREQAVKAERAGSDTAEQGAADDDSPGTPAG